MIATASALRKNIYRLLDQVADEGKPLLISRKGRILKVVREDPPSKLAQLTKHPCIKGDPEALVHLDWSTEWRHDLP